MSLSEPRVIQQPGLTVTTTSFHDGTSVIVYQITPYLEKLSNYRVAIAFLLLFGGVMTVGGYLETFHQTLEPRKLFDIETFHQTLEPRKLFDITYFIICVFGVILFIYGYKIYNDFRKLKKVDAEYKLRHKFSQEEQKFLQHTQGLLQGSHEFPLENHGFLQPNQPLLPSNMGDLPNLYYPEHPPPYAPPTASVHKISIDRK